MGDFAFGSVTVGPPPSGLRARDDAVNGGILRDKEMTEKKECAVQGYEKLNRRGKR